jgi:glycosyltransferase involved in cell wall biosynthesis
MNTPRISVIIPTFNSAQTLERALQSVFAQTISAVEIIVIDAGSSDATLQITQQHRERIAHVVSEKDNGIYDAINKGLQLATGEWIFILGSDDTLDHAQVFQELLTAAAPSKQLIFGNVKYTGSKQSLVPALHVSSLSGKIRVKNTLHQQSALYSRDLFADFRFNTSYRVLADYDFHLKLWKDKIESVHVSTTVAQCAAQGLSKRFRWSLYREELTIKRHRLSWILWLVSIPLVIGKFLLKQLP